MKYEAEIDNLFDVARDSIGRKIPDEYLADFLIAVNTERKKTKQALIELVAKAKIDELQHVDRHTTYYPDGSPPIEAQERIAELTKGVK